MAKAGAARNNPAMIIRRLSAIRAAQALPLLEAQYREHDIAMAGAPLLRALRQLFAKGNGAVFIARDPAPVGIALLSYQVSPERGGRIAWLEELYVVPERRGKGVGHALIVRALRQARRDRCATVELEVVRGHQRPARLYLREGFRKLPRTRYSRPA